MSGDRLHTDGLHTGGCRCGQVRFSTRAEPQVTSYCHCNDCRKASGSPVSAFVSFRDDEITWQARAYRSYSTGHVTRLFCPTCGTPLAYRDRQIPGNIYFMTGAMDAPDRYPPQVHAFGHRQLPWLALSDDLPRADGFAVQRPQTTQSD